MSKKQDRTHRAESGTVFRNGELAQREEPPEQQAMDDLTAMEAKLLELGLIKPAPHLPAVTDCDKCSHSWKFNKPTEEEKEQHCYMFMEKPPYDRCAQYKEVVVMIVSTGADTYTIDIQRLREKLAEEGKSLILVERRNDEAERPNL